MATEQYGQAHKVTPATDVFACAVIIWLMLTGELPWGCGETPYDQYNRQLNYQPTWPAHISLPYAEGWKEVLISALAADPTQRPATAQLFALLLAQRLEPDPPHVPSGLDLVSKLAPRFFHDLRPELETVRQPNGRIDVAAFWSPRSSHPGSTANPVNLDAIPVSAITPAAPHPASLPTVNARGHGSSLVVSSHQPLISSVTPPQSGSTLSAAAGATFQPPQVLDKPRSRRVWLVGVLAVLAAGGLLTFGIAMGMSSKNRRMSEATPMNHGSESTVLVPASSDAGISMTSGDAGALPSVVSVDAGVMTRASIATDQGPASKVETNATSATKKTIRVKAGPRENQKTNTADMKPSAATNVPAASAGSAAPAKKPYDPDAPKE